MSTEIKYTNGVVEFEIKTTQNNPEYVEGLVKLMLDSNLPSEELARTKTERVLQVINDNYDRTKLNDSYEHTKRPTSYVRPNNPNNHTKSTFSKDTSHKVSNKTNYQLPPIRVIECPSCKDIIITNKNKCTDDNFHCTKCNTDIPVKDDEGVFGDYKCPYCGTYHKVGVHVTGDYPSISVKCKDCEAPIDLEYNAKKKKYQSMIQY